MPGARLLVPGAGALPRGRRRVRPRARGQRPAARAAGARAGLVGLDRGQHGRPDPRRTSSPPKPWRAPRPAGTARRSPTTLLVLGNHGMFTDPIAVREVLHRCRDLAPRVGDEYVLLRAEALLRGAAWAQHDEQACRDGFDELRARLERLGDRETLAWFWFPQGAILYPRGEHEQAVELLARAVAVADEIGEATADRAARMYLALIEVAAGRAPRALEQMLDDPRADAAARRQLRAALDRAARGAGGGRLRPAPGRPRPAREPRAIDAWGMAHALAWAQAELAEVLRLLGEDDEAARHGARRARARADRLRNPWLAAKAQLTLGRLAVATRGMGGGRAPAPRRARDDLRAPLPPRAARRVRGAGGGGGRPRQPHRSRADPGSGRARPRASSASSPGPPSAPRSPRSRRASVTRSGSRLSSTRWPKGARWTARRRSPGCGAPAARANVPGTGGTA